MLIPGPLGTSSPVRALIRFSNGRVKVSGPPGLKMILFSSSRFSFASLAAQRVLVASSENQATRKGVMRESGGVHLDGLAAIKFRTAYAGVSRFEGRRGNNN